MTVSFIYRSVFLLLLLCLLSTGCNRAQVTGIETDEIDTSTDPQQTLISSQDPIVLQVKRGEFNLTPKAEYRIAALVVGRETYSYGWNAKISPVDLGLAWGKVADRKFRKYVSFSQGGRWTTFRVKEGSPLDIAYITSHAGNHHIIPSTPNIWYAVKGIKEKQKVVLEGLLVDVAGTYDGTPVRWKTSLTRTDTGDGACEILYVTKARIGNKVYE